jgi:hypothetical protein
MSHDLNTKQSHTQCPNTITGGTLCQTLQYRRQSQQCKED